MERRFLQVRPAISALSSRNILELRVQMQESERFLWKVTVVLLLKTGRRKDRPKTLWQVCLAAGVRIRKADQSPRHIDFGP